MKITVLHTTRTGVRAGADDAGYERDADKLAADVAGYLANRWYQRVAVLEINDHDPHFAMDTAYRLTNSVDEAWYETTNENIKVAAYARENGCRSSQIGDLFIAEREVYIVARVGFRKVEGVFDATTNMPNLSEQL